MSFETRWAAGTAAIVMSSAIALPVSAQPALEEIVVTARKREESLQEIPIAITAFSAAQLEKAGFKDLTELSLNVAGLQYHGFGLAIPGRVNSSVRFRGMDVNSQVPTFQLATVFVDGIYVLGNVDAIPFDDVERVEVVKGPQAAYFGRNTFGGAVNYITKTPSTSEFATEIKASGATYDDYEVAGSLEGPIVEDKLAFRIGGRLYSKGAMYTATDGGGLGEESSRTLQGTIYATPTESLSVRVRGFYGRDDDGAPAGGSIPGRLNDTCSGKTITTKAGQTVMPLRFICGQVPTLGNAIASNGTTKLIDSNTQLRSGRALLSTGNADYLLTNLVNKPYVGINVPMVDRIGLLRTTERYSVTADYEFANGMVATAQGGYNRQKASWIRDYNFTPFDNAYSRDPQDLEDFSVEGRVASAQDQPLRWLAGINYYEQDLITSGTGGDSVFLCVDDTPGLAIGNCRPNTFFAFNNALANTDHVETLGLYAAVSYDVSDQFSINLEGRRQIDKFTRGISARTTAKFKGWLPRVILQYKPTDETNLYASYAKGVLPGEINAAYIDASPSTQAQFDTQGVVGFLPQEKLDSYEIGWKQEFLDNRISINAAAYYGEWANKKSRVVATAQRLCGETNNPIGSVGCRPDQGEANLGQLARLADGTPVIFSANVVVAGTSKIWGFELEGNAAVTENLTTGFTLDYAGNKFTSFTANFIQPYARFTNVKGNAHARFPKWSGSLTSTYTGEINTTWDYFVRGDVSYFGKTFIDVDNLAYCNDFFIANARTGVEKEGFRLEFFVKNLFDDKNYSACARFSEFDLPIDFGTLTQYQTVIVAPQNKRQFGLRTSIKF